MVKMENSGPKDFKKAQIVLSYGSDIISSETLSKLYDIKKDVQVGKDENNTIARFLPGLNIPSSYNARSLIMIALEDLQVLPNEPATTLNLIYGNHKIDTPQGERNQKIELLEREIEFLEKIGTTKTLTFPQISDVLKDLRERDYVSWFGFAGTYVTNIKKASTTELENELDALKGNGKLFEQQKKEILGLLEKAPQTEVFIQEVDEINFLHESSETLDIFDVPKPVANWLPQMWNRRYLEDGKTARDMTQEELETEQTDLEKIVDYLAIDSDARDVSYSSLEELNENKKGTVDRAIEQLIEDYGRTGTLYGIKITERPHNRIEHEVARIDFDSVRKILQEKFEKQAKELQMRAGRLTD